MSDESEAKCSVLKARNRTLPGFEEGACATKWKGDYFFIQVSITHILMYEGWPIRDD